MCRSNELYFKIETEQDVCRFIENTNGLHDGYIISVQYEHRGHVKGNPHWINPALSELRIQILVTSIKNTIVELVFTDLVKWQLMDNGFDIVNTAISFDQSGYVMWADDDAPDVEERKKGSYVIAGNMRWRIE
ncbi:MAG: hypothetical protein IJZ85_06485 [Lachnospiraceae bacterium]|nr:hypothetical protein [Lachnospiraceae bacterium]